MSEKVPPEKSNSIAGKFMLVFLISVIIGSFVVYYGFTFIVGHYAEEQNKKQIEVLQYGIETTALIVDLGTERISTNGKSFNTVYYMDLFINETKETIHKNIPPELQAQVKQGDMINVVLIDKDSKENYKLNNGIVIKGNNIFLGNQDDKEPTIHIVKSE